LRLHNKNISKENIKAYKGKEETLTTQLIDPLTAKKKFVDSLTYYKQYIGNSPDQPDENLSVQDNVDPPVLTVKHVRTTPFVRKIQPKTQKKTIITVNEQVTEPDNAPITVSLKQIRPKARVRKVKPKVLTRKKTLVFTVQEVVSEETEATEAVNAEVVNECVPTSFEANHESVEEMTPEKAVTIDVDKLTEDDFYKILRFLESERDKLEGANVPRTRSWTKNTRKRVY
jgi:hypothetical protein